MTSSDLWLEPGKHEAMALARPCPRCPGPIIVRPMQVCDRQRGGRTVVRLADYTCPHCGTGWLAEHAPVNFRRSTP